MTVLAIVLAVLLAASLWLNAVLGNWWLRAEDRFPDFARIVSTLLEAGNHDRLRQLLDVVKSPPPPSDASERAMAAARAALSGAVIDNMAKLRELPR